MWNLNTMSTNCTLKFPLAGIYFQDSICISLGGGTWKNSHCNEFQLDIPVIRQLFHLEVGISTCCCVFQVPGSQGEVFAFILLSKPTPRVFVTYPKITGYCYSSHHPWSVRNMSPVRIETGAWERIHGVYCINMNVHITNLNLSVNVKIWCVYIYIYTCMHTYRVNLIIYHQPGFTPEAQ